MPYNICDELTTERTGRGYRPPSQGPRRRQRQRAASWQAVHDTTVNPWSERPARSRRVRRAGSQRPRVRLQDTTMRGMATLSSRDQRCSVVSSLSAVSSTFSVNSFNRSTRPVNASPGARPQPSSPPAAACSGDSSAPTCHSSMDSQDPISSLSVPIPPDLSPACPAGNTDLGAVPGDRVDLRDLEPAADPAIVPTRLL